LHASVHVCCGACPAITQWTPARGRPSPVAERADAATRTLYNHFSSRDELIAAAIDLLLQEARDSLYLDTPAEVDPAERLRQFVRLVYGLYGQQGDSLTILLDHRGDPNHHT
jgi:TetR/AcrR family transcriptional regulator, transcriptional repressor of bet genes